MTDDQELSREPSDSGASVVSGDAVSGGEQEQPQGPGWMPAILAATALMGIIGFVVCAFSTWLLFQRQTEFAVRTLRTGYLPQIEQSRLDPETKSAVVREIERLAADLEQGFYEDGQIAGMMQRLQRLPVLQWGQLQAVEAYLNRQTAATDDPPAIDDAERDEALKQLSRLKRAVELGKVNSFDFEDLLQPVRVDDPSSPMGYSLEDPLTADSVREVVQRAKLLADRSEIENRRFGDVKIELLVQRAIERGGDEGSF